MVEYGLLNLLTAIIGFAVSAILFFSPERNRKTNIYLGICFFAVSYRTVSIFIIQNGLLPNTYLLGTVSFVYYMIPPAYYLYFKRLIRDEQDFDSKDIFHFIVPFIASALLIYYFFASFIQTGNWHLPVQISRFNDPSPFPFYLQMGHHAILMTIVAVFYLVLTWRLRLKFLRRKEGEHSQTTKMRNWTDLLLYICTLLTIILFVASIVNWTFGKTVFNLNLLELNVARSLLLIFLFLRVLIKRDLLFGIPSIKTELPDIDRLKNETGDQPTITIYSRKISPSLVSDRIAETEHTAKEENKVSPIYIDDLGWVQKHEIDLPNDGPLMIEQDKVNAYIEQINRLMISEPYKNPDFDMKYISTQLQIPHYHVEYLFRYYNKYNFNEYRNLLRVRHVLKALERGLSGQQTIESVGAAAGFASRSSFFRVFKTFTGKTPKQYIEDNED